MDTPKIAVMQGRLSVRKEAYQHFPYGTWGQEFTLAKKMGLSRIEFIYDGEYKNPLHCIHGLIEIFNWMVESKVIVRSVCADYFMHHSLFDKSPKERIMNVSRLVNLISACQHLGIKDIIIPCIETSAIHTVEDKVLLKESLKLCLPIAEYMGVNLNLETDLNPKSFKALLDYLDHPNVKVNYDTGNSAFMGYDPEEELNTYGDKISIVHIKDRKKGGPSVNLGTGDANFEVVLKKLKEIDFKGQFTLQCARPERSTTGKEVNAVKDQLAIFNGMLERWFSNVG